MLIFLPRSCFCIENFITHGVSECFDNKKSLFILIFIKHVNLGFCMIVCLLKLFTTSAVRRFLLIKKVEKN